MGALALSWLLRLGGHVDRLERLDHVQIHGRVGLLGRVLHFCPEPTKQLRLDVLPDGLEVIEAALLVIENLEHVVDQFRAREPVHLQIAGRGFKDHPVGEPGVNRRHALALFGQQRPNHDDGHQQQRLDHPQAHQPAADFIGRAPGAALGFRFLGPEMGVGYGVHN